MGSTVLFVINLGSSSCKSSVYRLRPEPLKPVLLAEFTFTLLNQSVVSHDVSWKFDNFPEIQLANTLNVPIREALTSLLDQLTNKYEIVAIGHRLVHGGLHFKGATLIDSSVLNNIKQLIQYDTLHMTDAVAVIESLVRRFPATPQVACFDTTFYSDLPKQARLIALPDEYREAGVQRYGFHGLSYTYVQREFGHLAGNAAAHGRVIYAHLGSGSSITATKDGRVVDTTMGFSSASGLPSSTRVGEIDPTIPSFIMNGFNVSNDEFAKIAQTSSGLLAISGSTGDMKQLLENEAHDERAALAVSYYVYRVGVAIGGLVTALRGVDSLVFTGGIGSQSPIIRQRICDMLRYLDVELNQSKNEQHQDTISDDERSSVGVHVISTDEAQIIAEQTIEVIQKTEEAL
ncbi:MAG: acetate/propionate family kinase [Candidatus Saccharimonadales bacterium]